MERKYSQADTDHWVLVIFVILVFLAFIGRACQVISKSPSPQKVVDELAGTHKR